MTLAVTTAEAIKSVHVLAVITWLGAGVGVSFLMTLAFPRVDIKQRGMISSLIGVMAPRFFIPISLIAFASGLGLVLGYDYYDFSDTWVVIGLVGFAATFITGAAYLGPSAERYGEAVAAGDPGAPALERRLIWATRVDSAVLYFVALAMVLKI